MSSEPKNEFDWLKQQAAEDQEDPAALPEMERLWSASAQISMPASPDLEKKWQELVAESQRKRRTRPMRAFWPALVLAASLLVVSLWFFNRSPHFYSTKPGQTRNIQLADGSELVLNADSELQLSPGFAKENREMTLNGEAFFKVTKSGHPFVVHTNWANIQVTGTQFNVKAREEHVSVGVTEGTVMVSSPKNSEQRITLKQGDLVVCAPGLWAPLRMALPSGFPAWRHQQLFFDHTPLAIVCRDLERHFAIQIEIPPQDAALPISGLFAANEPHKVISALCLMIQRDFTVEGKTYRITAYP